MEQISSEQLETTKGVVAKLHAFYDGLADEERGAFDLAVRRLVPGDEKDTEGYRWREEKESPPPFVDPWDGKPWPWGLGVPPPANS